MFIKKLIKKCPCLFNKKAQNRKTFSNFQATYQKELYLLFEKSGIFLSQKEHRDRLDTPLGPCLFPFAF